MVRPSAQLPVCPCFHPLEGLGLFTKQSQAATRSTIGFPGRSEGGVVAHLSGLMFRTRQLLPQHKGLLYSNNVMRKKKSGVNATPATRIDTTNERSWCFGLPYTASRR
eukprot:501098-Amphidinium_carterae.1